MSGTSRMPRIDDLAFPIRSEVDAQRRAVINGLEADITALSLEPRAFATRRRGRVRSVPARTLVRYSLWERNA